VANLVSITVTIQTGDFSNIHNFVKNFVWDPIQSAYFSELRSASFVPKRFIKSFFFKKIVHGALAGTVG
jgi:hypothetical protein